MMCVNGEGWIGNTYYPYIGYLPAKDCKNNTENFLSELKKELMDNIKLVTEIQEGYFRHVKSGFWEKSEFGDYCYKPCSKGKGATLYYFAAFEIVKEEV